MAKYAKPKLPQKKAIARKLKSAIKDEAQGAKDYEVLAEEEKSIGNKADSRVMKSHAKDEKRHGAEDQKVLEHLKNLNWHSMSRDIQKDDIIRVHVGQEHLNPDMKGQEPSDWDGYIYGRAQGGFGMMKDSGGNAIFVDHSSFTYEGALHKTSKRSERWEKYWGIQLLN
jgi:hypothetical protein